MHLQHHQPAEVTEVRQTAQKHKTRGGGMDSQRVSASAPISPCRPARRTRWSPALPPGIREKMNVGLQVMIMFLTSFFTINYLSEYPKAQGDDQHPKTWRYSVYNDRRQRKEANPYNLEAGTRKCLAFYAWKRTINRLINQLFQL